MDDPSVIPLDFDTVKEARDFLYCKGKTVQAWKNQIEKSNAEKLQQGYLMVRRVVDFCFRNHTLVTAVDEISRLSNTQGCGEASKLPRKTGKLTDFLTEMAVYLQENLESQQSMSSTENLKKKSEMQDKLQSAEMAAAEYRKINIELSERYYFFDNVYKPDISNLLL